MIHIKWAILLKNTVLALEKSNTNYQTSLTQKVQHSLNLMLFIPHHYPPSKNAGKKIYKKAASNLL